VTDLDTGEPFDAKQREVINSIAAEALQEVREWAEKTRPHLSDPDSGFEWKLHVGYPSMETNENGDLVVTFPHEWLLVRVESAP
jgi:hypothetical protein